MRAAAGRASYGHGRVLRAARQQRRGLMVGGGMLIKWVVGGGLAAGLLGMRALKRTQRKQKWAIRKEWRRMPDVLDETDPLLS